MQGLAATNDNIEEQCVIATLVSMMSRCKRILTNFEKTDLSYTITQFSQICLMQKVSVFVPTTEVSLIIYSFVMILF